MAVKRAVARQSIEKTYHSRSLYMIVKKTCRNRFTAFISTANRYSHASPDIIVADLPLHGVEAS